MTVILILLALSVPVFYIFGVISFIRSISNNSSRPTQTTTNTFTTREDYLRRMLSELQNKPRTTTVAALIAEYSAELGNITSIPGTVTLPTIVVPDSKPAPAEILQKDTDDFWSNWYTHNSINILLYIGAFLIVASAGIFVGFQWEAIPGIMKALLLCFLTACFFGFGSWFYSVPKIRNAGITFIGIGALLIPVCGAGWYNFYFHDLGVPYSYIWLVTSIVALGVYSILIKTLKTVFYTYIAALSSISLAFSVVNVFQLESDFYILAGILSSLLLLSTKVWLKNAPKDMQQLYLQPLAITSHTMMPVTLAYGLFVAIPQNTLFSFAGTMSMLLAALFYAITYYALDYDWSLPVSLFFVAAGVFVWGNWIELPGEVICYAISIVSILEAFFAGLLFVIKKQFASDVNKIFSLIQFVFIFAYGILNNFSPLTLLFFSLYPIVTGIYWCYMEKKVQYLYISTIFSAYLLYDLIDKMLGYTDPAYVLGSVYGLAGIITYGVILEWRKRQDIILVGATSAALFFLLSLITNHGYYGFESLTLGIIALIFYSASWYFHNDKLIYYSNLSLSATLFLFLLWLHIPKEAYPLYFLCLYFGYYFISFFIRTRHQSYYHASALVGVVVVPVVAQISSSFDFSYQGTHSVLEATALFSAYAACFLYTIHALATKQSLYKYAASAIGLLTYLWQIHYLNVTELQMYTVAIGLYFLALGYIQHLKSSEESQRLFDIIGLGIIFLPAIAQTFDSLHGITYAITLGIEAIIAIGIGISLQYRLFTYTGIACLVIAIISQTYSYIFSIPRWVLVGILGILFLTVAIYLSLHKKEEK